MDDSIQSGTELSLAKMTVPIGIISEKHHHTNCTETIHLITGRIEQRIGEKLMIMSAGDTCLVPPNTSHQTRNIGDDTAVMMVAYSAGTRIYVKD